MRFPKISFAAIICLAWLLPANPGHTSDDFYLADGTRAVIAERQLVLIYSDSRRKVAPPGSYDTMDGRTIVVSQKGIEYKTRTK